MVYEIKQQLPAYEAESMIQVHQVRAIAALVASGVSEGQVKQHINDLGMDGILVFKTNLERLLKLINENGEGG